MPNNTEINEFLTKIFNKILKIEEKALTRKSGETLSVSEMHIIEKIGKDGQKRMSDVSKALNITLGTLTVSVERLEHKGYVARLRNTVDKRVVSIQLTSKGLAAFRIHEKFHLQMVDSVLSGLSESEIAALIKALNNLNDFFSKNYDGISD